MLRRGHSQGHHIEIEVVVIHLLLGHYSQGHLIQVVVAVVHLLVGHYSQGHLQVGWRDMVGHLVVGHFWSTPLGCNRWQGS